MKEQLSHQSVDPILLPILQTEDEVESQQVLEKLVSSHINPIIKEIIHHKLRLHTGGGNQQDGEDVQGNTVLKLLSCLRQFKLDPASRNISDFRSYVAVTAYNACNEYLRQKYPQRHSLKNQLRYLCSHFPPLAMWSADDDNAVCGLVDWQSQKRRAAPHSEVINLLNNAASLGLGNRPLIDVVTTLLRLLDRPLTLDDLVNLVAEAKGIRDETAQIENEEGASLVERLPDSRARVDAALEQRSHLERLWKEIAELPLRQRIALLLNLKDEHGNSQLEMFPLTGVATIRQIARVLEMSDEEFARLWNQLPMEDARIAERLKLTRQQIINLRKSARQRLAKRMRELAS
jgi:RNA polymerase sigma factor (sigma-70 family)